MKNADYLILTMAAVLFAGRGCGPSGNFVAGYSAMEDNTPPKPVIDPPAYANGVVISTELQHRLGNTPSSRATIHIDNADSETVKDLPGKTYLKEHEHSSVVNNILKDENFHGLEVQLEFPDKYVKILLHQDITAWNKLPPVAPTCNWTYSGKTEFPDLYVGFSEKNKEGEFNLAVNFIELGQSSGQTKFLGEFDSGDIQIGFYPEHWH